MAMTIQQQTDAYRFFAIAFGAAPGVTYMNQIADAYAAGMTTKQIVNVYTTKPQFTSVYPNFYTNAQFANALIENVVGTSASAAAKAQAKADVEAALNIGWTRGDVIYQIFTNLANKPLTDPDWGNTAKLLANQVAVARYYTEVKLGDTTDLAVLKSVIAGVTPTTDVSTTAALDAVLAGAATGQAFTLTTSPDNVVGTSGNDTVNGYIGVAATATTLTAADVIDGGAGTDSLKLTVEGTGTAVGAGSLPNASISNVEQFFIRDVATGASNYDFGAVNGETQVWADTATNAAGVTFSKLGTGATVGIKGNNVLTNLANVSFSMATPTDAVSIAIDGGVKNTVAPTITATAGTATAATIASTGAANTVGVVTLSGGTNTVKTLTINATTDLTATLVANDFAADATMVVTGAGKVNVGANFDGATIDASANTGGLTVSTTTGVTKSVTGSSAADAVTLVGSLTSTGKIDLGAGNDKLLAGAGAAIAGTNVIDGGAGTDTIVSTLLQVGNQANIKNWEVLDLIGENRTIDASLFAASNFQSVALSGALTGNTVVQKLSGAALNATITAGSGAFDLTAQLANGATSTADAANITFGASANATLQSFKSTGIETYNIVSGGATAAVANAITTLSDSLNTTAKVVITGANALTVGAITTNTAATTATAHVASALKEIDASAATGNVTLGNGTALGTSAAIGTSGFNTTYDGLKVTTGSGDDTITVAAKNAVISTGAGDDTITVSGSGATIDTGAAKTATGDVVNVNGASASLTVGAGLQTVNIQAGAAAAATLDKMTTITSAATGDKIDFTAILGGTDTNVDTITNVTTTIGGAASLTAALDLAAAAGGVQADGSIVYFNWVDGNTYLVGEVVGATDGLAAGDAVVKLVGTYSAFTATDGVVTLA